MLNYLKKKRMNEILIQLNALYLINIIHYVHILVNIKILSMKFKKINFDR